MKNLPNGRRRKNNEKHLHGVNLYNFFVRKKKIGWKNDRHIEFFSRIELYRIFVVVRLLAIFFTLNLNYYHMFEAFSHDFCDFFRSPKNQ